MISNNFRYDNNVNSGRTVQFGLKKWWHSEPSKNKGEYTDLFNKNIVEEFNDIQKGLNKIEEQNSREQKWWYKLLKALHLVS